MKPDHERATVGSLLLSEDWPMIEVRAKAGVACGARGQMIRGEKIHWGGRAIALALLALLLTQPGCKSADRPSNSSANPPFVEAGDLDDIRRRGPFPQAVTTPQGH